MNYKKARDHCHYTSKYRDSAHSLCNLRYQEQRDIPVIMHNGSNYDFHLLIKDLAQEFTSDIYCLGENTEKNISFSIPIHNKKIDNETINYNLKFIDSYRFMNFSLDSLVDNLSEINKKTPIRWEERNKNSQPCRFVKLDENRLLYKCLECQDISYKPLPPLIDKFPNTYRLIDNDNQKVILLLRKGDYPYEYIDDCQRFNDTKLPSIEDYYSNYHLKHISKKYYNHAKNVWNTFEIKNLGEYHDLYVQSETFRNKCIKYYELDLTYFVSAPGLFWEACLKRQK